MQDNILAIDFSTSNGTEGGDDQPWEDVDGDSDDDMGADIVVIYASMWISWLIPGIYRRYRQGG